MIPRLDAAVARYGEHRDFTRFESEAREDLGRIAHNLHGRWRLPFGVSVDDVRQELLASIWEAAAEWREGGMPFVGYVIWCGVRRTERWLHVQRSAKRRSAHSQSRLEAVASDVFAAADANEEAGGDAPIARAWQSYAAPARAYEVAVLRQALDVAARTGTREERNAVRAIARSGFDFDRTARRLSRRVVNRAAGQVLKAAS